MAYQVLARKWRPQRFADYVGQQHVVQALTNALTQDRVHHAYLFTGTRGVGKTTVARILAKCLNCQTGITATPCEQCESCLAINQGSFIDLYEIDAASRTKVEDMREILEMVQYPPTQGRFKIFLIDEVHMLSTSSFNALLKTLEEPPPYIKFFFATTDPQRMPETVRSRCLQFHLKALSIEDIQGHLQHICQQENVEAELPGLTAIANAAHGSIRDSLSLLDQAIAHGQGKITTDAVAQLLGTLHPDSLRQLIDALLSADGTALLSQIDSLLKLGANLNQVLEQLAHVIHDIALKQAIVSHIPAAPLLDAEQLTSYAEQIPPEALQLYYQILLHAKRDLPLAPTPRIGFEMALLRMLAFKPLETTPLDLSMTTATAAPAPTAASTATPLAPSKPTPAAVTAPPPTAPPAATPPPPAPTPAPPQASGTPITQLDSSSWAQLVMQLNLQGMTKALVEHCEFVSFAEQTLTLNLKKHHSSMLNDRQKSRISDALNQRTGQTLTLNINITDAVQDTPAQQAADAKQAKAAQTLESLKQDKLVQSLMQTFDAQLVPESLTVKNDA